jgi:hypothetical protein
MRCCSSSPGHNGVDQLVPTGGKRHGAAGSVVCYEPDVGPRVSKFSAQPCTEMVVSVGPSVAASWATTWRRPHGVSLRGGLHRAVGTAILTSAVFGPSLSEELPLSSQREGLSDALFLRGHPHDEATSRAVTKHGRERSAYRHRHLVFPSSDGEPPKRRILSIWLPLWPSAALTNKGASLRRRRFANGIPLGPRRARRGANDGRGGPTPPTDVLSSAHPAPECGNVDWSRLQRGSTLAESSLPYESRSSAVPRTYDYREPHQGSHLSE